MLAEVAEGDLRSCLNTLQVRFLCLSPWLWLRLIPFSVSQQFIKRKSTVVDAEAIKSHIVGMKDSGTSSTVVLERLFKKPPRKKGESTEDKFVNRILRDVQTCGEYEKISQGEAPLS